MEVCVDSLESAIAAFEGGANRIELCSSLNEGGLTPSVGLYKSIRKNIPQSTGFKIFCMIRPRSGDFLYSDSEIDCMEEDIKEFIELKADGLVFGAVTPEGLVDEEVMRELLTLIPPLKGISTTFHRAFDMCSNDWQTSLDIVRRLGFTRLLTSGQEKNAFEGRKRIREYVEYIQQHELNNAEQLIIIPGAGITASNLEIILKETSCKEFHASCRSSRGSQMTYRNPKVSMGSSDIDEYEIKYSDLNKVKLMSDIYHKVYRINSAKP